MRSVIIKGNDIFSKEMMEDLATLGDGLPEIVINHVTPGHVPRFVSPGEIIFIGYSSGGFSPQEKKIIQGFHGACTSPWELIEKITGKEYNFENYCGSCDFFRSKECQHPGVREMTNWTDLGYTCFWD